MMQFIIDHLWQSTLFVAAAWGLTRVLRGNTAGVRYWVWFAASVKFLVPFSLLAQLGKSLGPDAVVPPPSLIFALDMVAAPAAPEASVPVASLLLGVWVAGVLVIAALWLRRCVRIAALVRAAPAADIQAPLPVKLAARELEPSLVGVWRPVLLLPSGLIARLQPAELKTVIAHELSHHHRRDNLTAAVHMVAQALFWFHPLLWWIGGKLMEERERACDEAVLESGNDARTYAEAILKVCRFYLKSPVMCASGVSGADLKQRVEEIMMNQKAVTLSLAKKVVLGAAALGAMGTPLVLGWAQAASPGSAPTPASGLAAGQVAGTPELDYDDFLAAVQRGDVRNVTIIQSKVTGNYANGDFFRTTAPVDLWSSSQSLESLRLNGVSITVPPRSDLTRPNIGAAAIYPAESKAAKEEGAVVLQLTVDETGDVSDAKVDTSSGFARLDDASRETALNEWRFMPARVDGAPVVMKMKIRVNFRLNSDEPVNPN